MLITLDDVHIHLIGAMGENQHIAMPQNQIAAIIGENRDDGGSNGSSKSTFTYASPLSLFGAKAVGKTNKELKNDRIKGTPRVICKYTVDGKPLIVDRTIGGELKVTYNGKDIVGSTVEVQAQLEKIIGMTQDQFLQFSYKGQKTAEHFLTMGDSDKKDFLSSFFDTSKLDKMKEISDLKLSTLKKDKEKGIGALEQLESMYEEKKEALESTKVSIESVVKQQKQEIETSQLLLKSSKEQLDLLTTISEESILNIDTQYIEKKAIYEGLLENIQIEKSKSTESITILTGSLSELTLPKPDETANKYNDGIFSLQNARKELKVPDELKEELSTCVSLITEQRNGIKLIGPKELEISMAKQQILMNKAMIADIDSKPCPTCNRGFDDIHKEKQKAQFLVKMKEYEAILDSRTNELNLIKEEFSQETLEMLLTRQSELNSEIANYNVKAYNDIDTNIAQLKSELSSYLMQTKHDFEIKRNSIESKITEIKTFINGFEQNLKQAKNDMDLQKMQALSTHKRALDEAKSVNYNLMVKAESLKSQLAKIENDLLQKEKDLGELEAKLISAKDKHKEIIQSLTIQEHVSFILSKNGFTGYLFDSILDELNAEINSNLKLVPVTSKFVLNFTPDKTAKTTGEVSKSITYEMTKGGVESGLGKTSGAEELVILLSVDEAVETVLSRRLGINIGWKFLDEQLFWVDGNSKEYVFEFYRQKSKDKAYYIIDHASEFNAAIDCVIKIVKENDVSRIIHE